MIMCEKWCELKGFKKEYALSFRFSIPALDSSPPPSRRSVVPSIRKSLEIVQRFSILCSCVPSIRDSRAHSCPRSSVFDSIILSFPFLQQRFSSWFACSYRPIKPRDSPRARRVSHSRLQIAVSCSIHCTCAQFVLGDLSLAEDAIASPAINPPALTRSAQALQKASSEAGKLAA
ncbi:hypothetical protein K1719_013961 [Acacia pycnantha]|nr:hypothetical protein K1719_013961 [Acacia pycnantha]